MRHAPINTATIENVANAAACASVAPAGPKRSHVSDDELKRGLGAEQHSVPGLEARCFQHELDHLDGRLLLSVLDKDQRKEAMRELRGLERGQVSLGVNESSIHALLPALDRYRQLHPAIHIRVHRVFSRDVPREVLNHQLDMGVISYLPEERELATIEFYRDSLALVVWPGHRLAKCREVDISELRDENFVGHIVESPYRLRVMQMFARHRVPLRMDIELPTIESIKLFVEMQKGVAIVPRMCVEREVEAGILHDVRLRQMRVVRKLYLVYRQDRPLTSAAQELVEIIRRKTSPNTRTRQH